MNNGGSSRFCSLSLILKRSSGRVNVSKFMNFEPGVRPELAWRGQFLKRWLHLVLDAHITEEGQKPIPNTCLRQLP